MICRACAKAADRGWPHSGCPSGTWCDCGHPDHQVVVDDMADPDPAAKMREAS